MASSFDRWEKDPFFSAAEEVQESADRMQSTYRTWVHAKKEPSNLWNIEELRRDLQTTVGTTKWQLEEFERAVRSSYISASDDARERHRDFIVAIEDQISKIQNSLQESSLSEGQMPPSWVRLDEGERDELASFLSGASAFGGTTVELNYVRENGNGNSRLVGKESVPEASKDSRQSTELSSSEPREEKSQGHRRTASASADISTWKIAIADDDHSHNSANMHSIIPPRKTPSFSGFLSSIDAVPKLKWPKKGFRKLKLMDTRQEADVVLLKTAQHDRGVNACYEHSKSCLDGCDDYNKQLYGWYGALQRQLQRSQYQMQYSRPVQVAFLALLLCMIGLTYVLKIRTMGFFHI